jgi:acetyl-CoA carboxylase biotin carboxyl carrier protein
MIDIRKLKELVRLMVENDLSELDLKDQAETVTIKRAAGAPAPVVQAGPEPRPAAGERRPGGGEVNGGAEPVEDTDLLPIESPMVGTFYAAANPDSPAFVQVGSEVGPETTVCLIEAMKVFNEIKAQTTGKVERILVSNGDAVEFGQPLFVVRPA